MKINFSKTRSESNIITSDSIENAKEVIKTSSSVCSTVTTLYNRAKITFIDPELDANPTTKETLFEQLMDNIYYPEARMWKTFEDLSKIRFEVKIEKP